MASGNLTCYSLTCFLSPGVDFLCDTRDALWEMRELSLLSRVMCRLRYQTSAAVPSETGLSGSPFPLWEKSRAIYLATCCTCALCDAGRDKLFLLPTAAHPNFLFSLSSKGMSILLLWQYGFPQRLSPLKVTAESDYGSGAGPGSVSCRFHSWYWSLLLITRCFSRLGLL